MLAGRRGVAVLRCVVGVKADLHVDTRRTMSASPAHSAGRLKAAYDALIIGAGSLQDSPSVWLVLSTFAESSEQLADFHEPSSS